jgi:hypothetical protein
LREIHPIMYSGSLQAFEIFLNGYFLLQQLHEDQLKTITIFLGYYIQNPSHFHTDWLTQTKYKNILE